jgi:hypothetical protein
MKSGLVTKKPSSDRANRLGSAPNEARRKMLAMSAGVVEDRFEPRPTPCPSWKETHQPQHHMLAAKTAGSA